MDCNYVANPAQLGMYEMLTCLIVADIEADLVCDYFSRKPAPVNLARSLARFLPVSLIVLRPNGSKTKPVCGSVRARPTQLVSFTYVILYAGPT